MVDTPTFEASTRNPREIREYKGNTLDREMYAIEYATERAEGEAEGEAKGEARGEAKGEAKGTAKLLITLLEAKFGSLTQDYLDRIMNVNVETLTAWSIKMLQVEAIEDVFKD